MGLCMAKVSKSVPDAKQTAARLGTWRGFATKWPAQDGVGSKRCVLGCDPGAGHRSAGRAVLTRAFTVASPDARGPCFTFRRVADSRHLLFSELMIQDTRGQSRVASCSQIPRAWTETA